MYLYYKYPQSPVMVELFLPLVYQNILYIYMANIPRLQTSKDKFYMKYGTYRSENWQKCGQHYIFQFEAYILWLDTI
jgi:hypothetical protein